MTIRTLVVSLDGLAIAPLGAYGCSWNETPTIDRLAAAGAVFDRCIVTSDDGLEVLRALWSAVPGTQPLTVISDQRRAIELAGTFSCRAVVETEAIWHDHPAEDAGETNLAGLLATALDRLQQASDDAPLVWVHSDFLLRHWDAPHSYLPAGAWEVDEEDDGPIEGEDHFHATAVGDDPDVEQEEEDVDDGGDSVPPPTRFVDSVTPPAFKLGPNHDPDHTIDWMHTYACQINLLDGLIDAVLEAVADQPTRIILMGTSGFALGESTHFGGQGGPAYSPRIQVPFLTADVGVETLEKDVNRVPIVRYGLPCTPTAAFEASLAWPATVATETSLLSPTHWAQRPTELEPAVQTLCRDGAIGLTTPQWFYRRGAEPEASREQLFVKPDDRCDVNNVANRLPEVLDQLRALPGLP